MSPLVLPPLALADVRRWAVVVALGLLVLSAAAWWLTDAPVWVALVSLAPLVVLLWVSARRVHLDPETGDLTAVRLGVRRTTRLAEAEWVHLADVGAGCMALLVGPPRGATLRVGVLVVGRWAEDCRDPEVLHLLATALERHARTDDPLAQVLRLQAAHLQAGGDVASSPLAGIVLRPRSRRGSGEGSSSALARLLE
ncbi:hypothetical protein [Nocardioides aequoreus]|uniref:hypothetical protein n=1 Tax=Nocardioides aequoreus TaxID=397278 RepID=UPI0004C35860|nr:hypothetical protein [Nocardioides aequoreus]